MFTDDYKELRVKMLSSSHFVNMVHLGADAFPEINGEVVQTTAFVLGAKKAISRFIGKFVRLVDYPCDDKPRMLKTGAEQFLCTGERFSNVKATPFSYWLSNTMRKSFDIGVPFEEYGNPRAGITTGENDRFMRNWHEVDFNKIGLHYASVEEFHDSGHLYIPYNKGGKQIRWYGNNDYVLMFDKRNYDILSNQGNGDLQILADGMSTDAGNRDKVLKAANGNSVALKYKDIAPMKRAERSALVKGMDVVYIYHDKVDEASHTSDSMVFVSCKFIIIQGH